MGTQVLWKSHLEGDRFLEPSAQGAQHPQIPVHKYPRICFSLARRGSSADPKEGPGASFTPSSGQSGACTRQVLSREELWAAPVESSGGWSPPKGIRERLRGWSQGPGQGSKSYPESGSSSPSPSRGPLPGCLFPTVHHFPRSSAHCPLPPPGLLSLQQQMPQGPSWPCSQGSSIPEGGECQQDPPTRSRAQKEHGESHVRTHTDGQWTEAYWLGAPGASSATSGPVGSPQPRRD